VFFFRGALSVAFVRAGRFEIIRINVETKGD